MQICKHDVSVAFMGTMADVEKAQGMMVHGFEGTAGHPLLPTLMDRYRFNKDAFQTVSYAWNREWARSETDPRRGVWWGGPKGAGKTTLTEQYFARLGVPVFTLTCNRRIPLSDFLSKMVPDGEGGWMTVPGPLMLAMQEGYPVMLNEPSSMDEADLIAMHDIIDRGLHVLDDGTVIKAARGFMVFAADNTMGYGDATGAHVGTNALNSATMRRFIKFEVDYPSLDEELSILKARFIDVAEEVLTAFVKFANVMREPYRTGTSSVTMGTGELLEWVEAAMYFDGLKRQGRSPAWFAFKRVMGGIPPVEMAAARASFRAVFGIDVSGE